MAKLYGPHASVSVGGVLYLPADGCFEVPEAAVAELLSHGLSRTPPPCEMEVVEIKPLYGAGTFPVAQPDESEDAPSPTDSPRRRRGR